MFTQELVALRHFILLTFYVANSIETGAFGTSTSSVPLAPRASYWPSLRSGILTWRRTEQFEARGEIVHLEQ